MKSGHADCDDVNNSHVLSGLYPYPGQRVECVQALHRVQGAPQPPEDAVSTGGHLQLPTQESHREQGELKLTQPFCVTDYWPFSVTMSLSFTTVELWCIKNSVGQCKIDFN